MIHRITSKELTSIDKPKLSYDYTMRLIGYDSIQIP